MGSGRRTRWPTSLDPRVTKPSPGGLRWTRGEGDLSFCCSKLQDLNPACSCFRSGPLLTGTPSGLTCQGLWAPEQRSSPQRPLSAPGPEIPALNGRTWTGQRGAPGLTVRRGRRREAGRCQGSAGSRAVPKTVTKKQINCCQRLPPCRVSGTLGKAAAKTGPTVLGGCLRAKPLQPAAPEPVRAPASGS